MMRRVFAAILLAAVPLLATAQDTKLKLPPFEHLRGKATQSVDLTIGSWPLGIASWLMDDTDPEDREMKELLRGLKSVTVRSYEFDEDFVYSESDVEAVRAQLTAPAWTPLMQVRNHKKHEAVDVYVALDGNRANGIAIVASEPREFTILNIVGHIDLDKLGKLEAHLGLPRLGIEADTALAHDDRDFQ